MHLLFGFRQSNFLLLAMLFPKCFDILILKSGLWEACKCLEVDERLDVRNLAEVVVPLVVLVSHQRLQLGIVLKLILDEICVFLSAGSVLFGVIFVDALGELRDDLRV